MSIPVILPHMAKSILSHYPSLDMLAKGKTCERSKWTRFIAIKVNDAQGRLVSPLSNMKNVIVILDRHFHRSEIGPRTRGSTLLAFELHGKIRLGYLQINGTCAGLNALLKKYAEFPSCVQLIVDSVYGPEAKLIGRVCSGRGRLSRSDSP
jgi:hypothetical protein